MYRVLHLRSDEIVVDVAVFRTYGPTTVVNLVDKKGKEKVSSRLVSPDKGC